MPATVVKLGPGILKIGTGGTAVDFSCQVLSARVEWEVDEGDDVVVLCGESVPGARTYSATLSVSMLSDWQLGPTAGLVNYSWANKGTQIAFSFQPVSSIARAVTGTVIVDPISVGGDESGQNMTSDFEWAIVGAPILGTPLALDAELEAGYAVEPDEPAAAAGTTHSDIDAGASVAA